MPQFESTLGAKGFSGNSGLREYDVPDESPYTEDRDFTNRMHMEKSDTELAKMEQEIKAAKEARRTGKERLNEGAKRRIEMLLGMTKLTRSVELDGNIYSFQTLRSQDMREVYILAAQFDGTVQFPYEIRRQSVARSLTQIAGLEVVQFLGDNSLESRLAFLDQLPEPFVQRLFVEYQELVKESNDKYAVKTEAEMREVVEDLKK